MFGLAHRAVLLAPAEDAFDHRPTRLRHAIAFVRVVHPSMALRRRLPVAVMQSFCVTCGVTLMARRYAKPRSWAARCPAILDSGMTGLILVDTSGWRA